MGVSARMTSGLPGPAPFPPLRPLPPPFAHGQVPPPLPLGKLPAPNP